MTTRVTEGFGLPSRQRAVSGASAAQRIEQHFARRELAARTGAAGRPPRPTPRIRARLISGIRPRLRARSSHSVPGHDDIQRDRSAPASLAPAFTESTAADVDAAFQPAVRAFAVYSSRTPAERPNFLRAIATEIESVASELTARAQSETALPAQRLAGERGRPTGQLRLIADAIEEGSWVEPRIDRGNPQRAPLPKPYLRRMLVPLGPALSSGRQLSFPLRRRRRYRVGTRRRCTVVQGASAQPGRRASSPFRRARAGQCRATFSSGYGWSNDVGVTMFCHHSRP